MDTLAFNEETNSFVIIEYKIKENYGVIDQGFSYLFLLLNRKADFVIKYNETFDTNLGLSDFDFSQSKVMFITPSYNKYQLKAAQFEDIAFELWKVKKYSDGNISFDKVKARRNSASINKISNSNSIMKSVNQEIKKYTEEEYFTDKTLEAIELYNNLKELILSDFDDVEIVPMKKYIKFMVNNQIIATFLIQKTNLKIQINSTKLTDPDKLAREIEYGGGEGVGKYVVKLYSEDKFDYFMGLFKQSYDEKI